MITFSIMMWFVSIILVFLSISLLRGNYASVHGKVLDSTDDKEGYAKDLGKPILYIVFTKAYLSTIKYTQIGYKKFEPEELIEYGKRVGFERIELKEIISGKSYVVIYTK